MLECLCAGARGHALDTRLDQSQLHAEATDKPHASLGSGRITAHPSSSKPTSARSIRCVTLRPPTLPRFTSPPVTPRCIFRHHDRAAGRRWCEWADRADSSSEAVLTTLGLNYGQFRRAGDLMDVGG